MIGFLTFPGVLVLYEIKSVSSMIWTLVTVSISYDDTCYTSGAYHFERMYIFILSNAELWRSKQLNSVMKNK